MSALLDGVVAGFQRQTLTSQKTEQGLHTKYFHKSSANRQPPNFAVRFTNGFPRCSISTGIMKRSKPFKFSSRCQSHILTAAGNNESVPSDMVELAHRLADEAATITKRYFRRPLGVEVKGDSSPVTEADRQAEACMRELINQTFPDHSVFGEEAGLDLRGDQYCWVLDPIDGTKSFITGKPVFGTLVALVKDGTPVLGVIDQPITKERWVGVSGRKTTLNGEEISTKQSGGDLSTAYMYSTTPLMFEGRNLQAYNRLAQQVQVPLYGCDCYAYGLLSAGFCDLVVEADMKPYDFMALVPVVQGAGGVFTNWQGEEVKFDAKAMQKEGVVASEVIAACDKSMHKAALDVLSRD